MGRFGNKDILQRAFNFAVDIIKFVQSLEKDQISFIISNQLGRCGSSVGANLEEADASISKKEFIKFVNISKREAKESNYWLRLIEKVGIKCDNDLLKELIPESSKITKILFSIVKRSGEGPKEQS